MKLEENRSFAISAASSFLANSSHYGVCISDSEAKETSETHKEQVLEAWCTGSDSL
jgi:hypothetical protein